MQTNEIVSPSDWVAARKLLLQEEKDLQRARDALAVKRRALPWVLVDKDYHFDTSTGQKSLEDLFNGRDQLIVWHFMFGEDWSQGCPSCSFWADQYVPGVKHMNHRDVSLVAVSTAPLVKLLAYRDRMGWSFVWVSSGRSDFNRDFAVTFETEIVEGDELAYNFETLPAHGEEMPGLSVFARGDDGAIYRTYSTYARGLDPMNAVYQHLDLTPKSRDEEGLSFPMEWVRRHDQY